MFEWLEATALATWVKESWGWPLALTIHAFGSATMVGFSFIMALRLMGLYRTIPPSSSTTQTVVSSRDTSRPAKCFTAAPPRCTWPMYAAHAPPSWAEQPPPGREPQSLHLLTNSGPADSLPP